LYYIHLRGQHRGQHSWRTPGGQPRREIPEETPRGKPSEDNLPTGQPSLGQPPENNPGGPPPVDNFHGGQPSPGGQPGEPP
jgi:hypothetical protein